MIAHRKAKPKPFSRSQSLPGRRFTHPDHPGVVFVQMDRTTHFDGETRTAYVHGLRLNATGGAWERFLEETVQYV